MPLQRAGASSLPACGGSQPLTGGALTWVCGVTRLLAATPPGPGLERRCSARCQGAPHYRRPRLRVALHVLSRPQSLRDGTSSPGATGLAAGGP